MHGVIAFLFRKNRQIGRNEPEKIHVQIIYTRLYTHTSIISVIILLSLYDYYYIALASSSYTYIYLSRSGSTTFFLSARFKYIYMHGETLLYVRKKRYTFVQQHNAPSQMHFNAFTLKINLFCRTGKKILIMNFVQSMQRYSVALHVPTRKSHYTVYCTIHFFLSVVLCDFLLVDLSIQKRACNLYLRCSS